jgi:hypothetical protein
MNPERLIGRLCYSTRDVILQTFHRRHDGLRVLRRVSRLK